MRPSARELSALIGAVYEAGLDLTGARWPAALERLSVAVAGDGPVGLIVAERRLGFGYAHSARTDPRDAERYVAHYGRIDPVFEPRLPDAPRGALLLSDALVPMRELRRTEFYADWMRPLGLGAGAAAVVSRHGAAAATLYAVRPRGRGPFRPTDVETLHLLLPHLGAAVRASLHLAGLTAERDAAADALGRWTDAVLLVDGQSGLHAANEAAESLLRLGDVLALEPDRGLGRGRLRAATPAGTAVLRRLIAAAAALAVPRTGAPALPPRDMALALVRASGRPALAALVAPLSPACAVDTSWVAALSADVSRAAAVLFVSDPTATAGDATALLRLRINYGLTPAEAAIAVAVAGGQGLQAVAAAQGVALATVRTQVQHAYRKAGVRGQAALARLVERLAQVRS